MTWQPPQWVDVVDDIHTRVIYLERKNFLVPQHVHTYDHNTLLAHGSVRLFKNGAFEDHKAPKLIKIDAHTEHYFLSLEENTVICCIHNTHGMDDVSVEREGKLWASE